ncbi:hypothetical protein I305_02788 [Cryptococcus gattii E566]|uniref:BTB domain-containing protein n=2 Tax=Cryptococcus gattii TaxID=37769 RepID=E6R6K4_CRYGW|nr:uncharacterized protein CGB_E1290W [Cryptococcus gattii WM276]ADV22341.1 hypothetical protein CNE01070 [Cryptococcus gattii WM276]KIR78649.1 hypothetical protein I306_04344 [Cryptococcus gattii EJB2]KIY34600.1 hypothetical protein I305_02788 [Cryptococcus gattii E566]KJE04878.1 hypothetical protein I311_01326 [Cryptococcus gattii NT-10]
MSDLELPLPLDIRDAAGKGFLLPTARNIKPTDPKQSPKVIHPLYPCRHPDDILLVTEDNVGFYVSLALITRHCGFFEGYESLKKEITGEEESSPMESGGKEECHTERRELPSAKSSGLHLVLDTLGVIESLTLAAEAANYTARNLAMSAVLDFQAFNDRWPLDAVFQHLAPAVQLADAYDIPKFIAYMCLIIPDDPWHQYLMAALSNNETFAKKTSRETVKYHISDMPPPVVSILYKNAPSYLWRLRKLHTEKMESYPGLKMAWRCAFPMYDKNEDFGHRCQKGKFGVPLCIPHGDFNGDFGRLRATAADRAFGILKREKSDEKVKKAIKGDLECWISCHRCRRRLVKTFLIIRDNWVTQWRPQSI